MGEFDFAFGIIGEGISLRTNRRWGKDRLNKAMLGAVKEFGLSPDAVLEAATTISDCVDVETNKTIADSAANLLRMVAGGDPIERPQRPDTGLSRGDDDPVWRKIKLYESWEPLMVSVPDRRNARGRGVVFWDLLSDWLRLFSYEDLFRLRGALSRAGHAQLLRPEKLLWRLNSRPGWNWKRTINFITDWCKANDVWEG